MKTKLSFGSFFIAGIALLLSCNSVADFSELPEPGPPLQQILQGKYCVYPDIKQCFSGSFDFTACPGEGFLTNYCPYTSSSSTLSNSSSSTLSNSSSSIGPPSSSSFYCLDNAYEPSKEFCDTRDFKLYKIVTIGSQTWMAENLNYATASGSKCYLNNPDKCTGYGRLYNWAAATEACPDGWKLPSKTEWETLKAFVGDDSSKLKAQNGWNGYNGSNTTRFTALPGGRGDNSSSYDEGYDAYWWSSTPSNASNSYSVNITYNYSQIYVDFIDSNTNMYSVRCIEDL